MLYTSSSKCDEQQNFRWLFIQTVNTIFHLGDMKILFFTFINDTRQLWCKASSKGENELSISPFFPPTNAIHWDYGRSGKLPHLPHQRGPIAIRPQQGVPGQPGGWLAARRARQPLEGLLRRWRQFCSGRRSPFPPGWGAPRPAQGGSHLSGAQSWSIPNVANASAGEKQNRTAPSRR